MLSQPEGSAEEEVFGVALELKPFDSYLSEEGDLNEIDEKSKDQMARRHQELLREFAEFKETKQQLLNLREEALDEVALLGLREEISAKVQRKKKEMEKQYELFIGDHLEILRIKRANFAQIVLFEKDERFQRLQQSSLSESEKHRLRHLLYEYRTEMVARWIEFYAKTCSEYKGRL